MENTNDNRMKGEIYYGSFEYDEAVKYRGKIAYWQQKQKCTTFVKGQEEKKWSKIVGSNEVRNKKVVDTVYLGETNYEIQD